MIIQLAGMDAVRWLHCTDDLETRVTLAVANRVVALRQELDQSLANMTANAVRKAIFGG